MLTVAVFIALELGSATTFLHVLDTSVALNDIRAVQAFAFFAVSVIFGATTVTAIPSTASIVTVQNNDIRHEITSHDDIAICASFKSDARRENHKVTQTHLLSSQLPSPFHFGAPQPFLIALTQASPLDTKVQSRH